MSTHMNAQTETALTEIRKTRDTADRLANGEAPEEADQVRVLAGLIRQLSEQVERHLESGSSADRGPAGTSGRDAATADSRSRRTGRRSAHPPIRSTTARRPDPLRLGSGSRLRPYARPGRG